MVEMAAMDGSTPYSMALKIFTGSVIWPAPSRKIDTGTLSNDTMNEKSAPAATPGADEGQRDREERDRPAGAEDARGVLELRVDPLEARRHRPDHVGHGDHHVGEGQAHERAVHVDQRVELQQRHAHDHAGKDQRRVEQRRTTPAPPGTRRRSSA